jgi:hypothetical protein
VLRGGASEAAGMPPYLPFLEALGQHVRTTPPDELRVQAGDTAGILTSILPELVARLGEAARSYPLPPEQAQLRLYEAVNAFLAALASERPLALIFDDLQWADGATLDLLAYLARRQRATPLLVGAYRAGDAERRAAFAQALAELNRLRALDLLTLGPLDVEAVVALAENYLGSPVTTPLGETLFRQSEGNPFFAEELLCNWRDAGALTQTERGRWTLTAAQTPTLPPGIAGAVRQRLARLRPETVELLRTAAILGRRFETALLAEVVGQDVEVVEESLREATLASLLNSASTGAQDVYTFSHDKIRESLYEDMTHARRQRLHGFIGHALEARSQSAGAQRLAELAYHFARSGDRIRGADYARRAAQLAMAAYAPEEALAHYHAATAYRERPSLTCGYYSYWSGVDSGGLEAHILPRPALALAFPTNDNLTCVAVQWPVAEFHAVRADIEKGFFAVLDLVPSLAARVRDGRREERFRGTADLPNFIRQAVGPGWALVGDAGAHKDPLLATGISDAFKDAATLAAALVTGLSGREPLDASLATWGRQRDATILPSYESSYLAASFPPPSPELLRLRAAIRGNQAAIDAFLGLGRGTTTDEEFTRLVA